MSFIFLILFLSSSTALLGFSGLEAALAILVLTPVWGFLLGHFIPLNFLSYWTIIIVSIGLLAACRSSLSMGERNKLLKDSLVNSSLFCLVFLVNRHLALSWPDFFPMGERLRDYALIASSMHDPISSSEPWLYGHQTSYYLFWYRFGDAISELLNFQPWDTYHFLNAWGLSLLWGGTFLLSRSVISLGVFWSALIATFISYGSNYDGLAIWWNNRIGSEGWWGPSRVIAGAITEFPAWSFILGDNHPHFLSYGIASLSITIISRISSFKAPSLERATLLTCISLIVLLILFNANAWEVPMWIGFLTVLLCARAPSFFPINGFLTSLKEQNPNFKRIAYCCSLTLIAIISLICSARFISSGSAVLRLVAGRAPFSTTSEILRHWGIPLTIIFFSQFLNNQRSLCGRFLLFSGAVISLLSNNPFTLISSILAFEAAILWDEARLRRSVDSLIISSLTVSSLGAILLCELIFLDDPYGGQNERMNTIFKWYAFAWPLLHLGSFARLSQTTRHYGSLIYRNNIRGFFDAIPILFVAVGSAFFVTVAKDFRSKESRSPIEPEGLSRVEEELQGSRETIRKLRELRYGAVLEAQGRPYWWTTHIATLSGMPSYLGWANHVNLLVKEPAVITKRELNTQRWYTSPDCITTREELLREKISYVVLGPLEKKEYQSRGQNSFGCLNLISEHGEYQLFEISKSESSSQ